MSFLSALPAPEELVRHTSAAGSDRIFEANGHIHTPYSFSSFSSVTEIFRMAVREGIEILGINDFYVTDGYTDFYNGCLDAGIFPLFNIEFIGLMKQEQSQGVRINDPNNPGRIYFCGKGLDYPFHLAGSNLRLLENVKEESQKQLREMVKKLNDLISTVNPYLELSFDLIRERFAKDLVRERHLAKALRILAMESFTTPAEQLGFIEAVYGGKKSKAGVENQAALENEIRSNLLKAGGAAFVEEEESSFLPVESIIGIIAEAGGIPCYPVLLDDASGKITEFESDSEELRRRLTDLGVGCIELIPGRNDHDILESFADYFDRNGFIVLFGTEHNTPGMSPLKVTARGGRELSRNLRRINSRGAAIIAAHQYLRAVKREGLVDENGRIRSSGIEPASELGYKVLEYTLNKKI